MADADLTYDFAEIPRFVGELDGGAELVIGDRMENIQPGAMPWLHRYIGNPILTGILNVFFRTGVSDAHCGMRALRRDVLPRLDLRTTGMEFASEMVIRASKEKLEIARVPDRVPPARRRVEALDVARRLASPALPARAQPDASLHRPGAVMAFLGAVIAPSCSSQVHVLGRTWDLHTMIAGCAADRSSAPRSSRWASARTPTASTSWASAIRGSTACARASSSSTDCCSAAALASRASSSARSSWASGPRGFGALVGAAPRGRRRDAPDRRHPDLLLVLPAQHPWAAARRPVIRPPPASCGGGSCKRRTAR